MQKWMLPLVAIFFCSFFLSNCQPIPTESIPTPPTLPSSPLFPIVRPDPSYWTPQIGSTFQIQLSDYPPDLDQDADIFELDLFEATASTIHYLHQRGKKVICYFNAGAWEEFRPDAKDFPQTAIGKAYRGWPGENWLDISQYETFAHLIQARLDLAMIKECDGVDPDNIDGYQQPTGFAISQQDQLAYNIWLSEQAHLRGLAIAMKNDGEQIEGLIDHYDFAVLEDCAVYDECALYLPFIHNRKAVFQIEYSDRFTDPRPFCAESRAYGFCALFKHRDLDAFVEYCP